MQEVLLDQSKVQEVEPVGHLVFHITLNNDINKQDVFALLSSDVS